MKLETQILEDLEHDNTNEHSFEGIFSQSHNPIFSLVGENQERSEVFMGGFGKILPFEDLNSSEGITSSYITCIANNYRVPEEVGWDRIFFSKNYQFQMM